MATNVSREHDLRPDEELLAAVRGGDNDAYAELFRRYRTAALRQARRWVRVPTDEDVASEAFRSTLQAIRRGAGPRDGRYLPYLLAAVRNSAAREMQRQRYVVPTDDTATLDHAEPFSDPTIRAADSRAGRAFAALSSRHRAVLWHTVLNGETPGHAAAALGMTAEQTRDTARRARRSLAAAYGRESAKDSASAGRSRRLGCGSAPATSGARRV